MTQQSIETLVVLGAFGLLWLSFEYLRPGSLLRRFASLRRKLPPGPPGIPIFGNMFQFTRARDAGLWGPFVSSRFLPYGGMTN